ncbi:MAG: EF-P beta-lysylation protein EpmB [SAR86 cluster bacterium]|uniref:L-lysine 2,3-aminomutase n=1 Tax=SAR86 cluster bacterium TaxID=2030880 RepID=A0A2A4MTA6_9GAMM|nr:MAG: EF-P beta-lysylation protein EpmB [SAR86 cluster bacterium]
MPHSAKLSAQSGESDATNLASNAIALHRVDDTEIWQQILSDLITDPKELVQLLQLDSQHPQAATWLNAAQAKIFPLKAPRPFVDRIEKGNWQDPLLMQLLPTSQELQTQAGFVIDPLGEQASNALPGLLHKYKGRVLLTAAPHCAIHCRYCFRRHFDYRSNTPNRRNWLNVMDYIRADSSIEEVILSGGDPLAAGDSHLAWLCQQIANIPHVHTLRIHTRLPIVIPQRVSQSLLTWLAASRLKIVMVLHCNHAQEIDDAVAQAIGRLSELDIILLNQSVLLKGVNDNVQALTNLSRRLFSLNILPYYLHLVDKVQGVGHFDVSQSQAAQLISAVQAVLPGYLVPTLVREIAGENSKTRLL